MSSEFSNARENFEAFQSNVNILSVTQTQITNAIRLGFLEPKAFVNYAESARMQERFGRRLPIIPPTVFYKKGVGISYLFGDPHLLKKQFNRDKSEDPTAFRLKLRS